MNMLLVGAIIVAIIIVIFVMMKKPAAAESFVPELDKDMDRANVILANLSPEERYRAEQQKYYYDAKDTCNKCDGDNAFAEHEYGREGLSYKDYIAGSAISEKQRATHAEFVKDRMSKQVYATRGAFAADSHQSYNTVPWVGLRRPQHVPVVNPDQVAEYNSSAYDYKPKFTWRSS